MKLLWITKMTVLPTILLALAGLAVQDVNGQSARQIERERQRIERQRERQMERYDRERYRYDRYETTRTGSRAAGVNNAVSMGYQQGLMAGEYDRRKRKYNQSNVYRNTGAAPYSGDPTNYDYLYRQGYLQGYEDGYYGRSRY